MSTTRRSVHIPIVQPSRSGTLRDSSEDRLIEVYTQLHAFDALTRAEEERVRSLDAKAADKDWDRVAAPLRKVGLYQAGCTAASAARKLGVEPPLTALYQRVSRLAWIEGQRLQSASGQGPSEGRSAELGLALVLLMCASGSRDRQIIATGALGGQPEDVTVDDVQVLPVGSLPEKLRLVATLARHKSLPRYDRSKAVLFFTPKRFERGDRWEDTESLPEVDELRELGVRVVPVDRLGEAAGILNARRSRHLAHDHVAQLVVATLLFALSGFGVYAAWPEPHVPIRFLPGGGLALNAEPFEACFTADGGYYPVPLGREGVVSNLPAGQTLAWRVQVGDEGDDQGVLGRWFAPEDYHVAYVMLSEHSSAKVTVPVSHDGSEVLIRPGGVWEWAWRLNDRPEGNKLVLLAQPDKSFDADALRAALLDRFPGAAQDTGNAPVDITAAANFLAAQAPGSVRFDIQTVERTSRCNP